MSATQDEVRRTVLRAARGWLGTPYRHQQARKGVGADCLGLVRGIWREVYGVEPEVPEPYSADWGEASGRERLLDAARRHCREITVDDARPGDLVLFRWRRHLPAKHAGILSEAGFIHAYERHAVIETALVPQWRARLAAAFAFPTTRKD